MGVSLRQGKHEEATQMFEQQFQLARTLGTRLLSFPRVGERLRCLWLVGRTELGPDGHGGGYVCVSMETQGDKQLLDSARIQLGMARAQMQMGEVISKMQSSVLS